MFARAFTGGDRGPQHWRQNGRQRSQIPHRAAFDKLFRVGHLATIHKILDDFPVRGVPADQQNFF